MRTLILASSSPRRREILERLGTPFIIEPSDFEEDMTLKLSPKELAETLATGKAEAVAIKHADAVVIGADTFVELDGLVLGKPLTEEKNQEMLMRLSGKTHAVHTGYCIIDSKTGQKTTGVETTNVTFRALTKDEIAAYAANGEALTAAGGYMIQKGGAEFVIGIEGSYDNIVGFPIETIKQALEPFGVHP